MFDYSEQHDPPTTGRIAYSRIEAAAALGISLRTLDRLVRDGRLTPLRVRRRVLVTAKDLDRLLEQEGVTTRLGWPRRSTRA